MREFFKQAQIVGLLYYFLESIPPNYGWHHQIHQDSLSNPGRKTCLRRLSRSTRLEDIVNMKWRVRFSSPWLVEIYFAAPYTSYFRPYLFQFLFSRISCVPPLTYSECLLTVLHLAWLTGDDFVLQMYLPLEWRSPCRYNFPFPNISWRDSFCSITLPPSSWRNAITRECAPEGRYRFALWFFRLPLLFLPSPAQFIFFYLKLWIN